MCSKTPHSGCQMYWGIDTVSLLKEYEMYIWECWDVLKQIFNPRLHSNIITNVLVRVRGLFLCQHCVEAHLRKNCRLCYQKKYQVLFFLVKNYGILTTLLHIHRAKKTKKKQFLPSAASCPLLFPANWTLTVFCWSCVLTPSSDNKANKLTAQRWNMLPCVRDNQQLQPQTDS